MAGGGLWSNYLAGLTSLDDAILAQERGRAGDAGGGSEESDNVSVGNHLDELMLLKVR